MTRKAVEFIEDLIGELDALRQVKEEVYEEWAPELPSVILLYSRIGRAIVHNFRKSKGDCVRVLEKIEKGMQSSDEYLCNAIATGFIEAMYAESCRESGLWDEIRPFLGGKTGEYADLWINFPG
jgi:hypothetical protein